LGWFLDFNISFGGFEKLGGSILQKVVLHGTKGYGYAKCAFETLVT